MNERFYVVEHHGYPNATEGRTNKPWVPEVMVLDRGYCHRVVWTSWGEGKLGGAQFTQNYIQSDRDRAAELAARLNRECARA